MDNNIKDDPNVDPLGHVLKWKWKLYDSRVNPATPPPLPPHMDVTIS